MIRRLCVVILCALAPIAVLAGCGSSAPKAPTAKHATTTTTPTVPLSAKLRVAIVACQKVVATNAYIPASEKPAGETDCKGVKSGDVTEVKALNAILLQACLKKVVAVVPTSEQPAASTACKKVY
jgi:hypothetical protein